HALANAREALARKLAETSSQRQLLEALRDRLELPRTPLRIEVFDNSHVQGSNAVGAMIVAGPEGFRKNQYRKFNIRSPELTPGDDFAMMREVLGRRFKRLIKEAPRVAAGSPVTTVGLPPPDSEPAPLEIREPSSEAEQELESPWPDLVLIDGGRGQLN